jgi:hypothetical protein
VCVYVYIGYMESIAVSMVYASKKGYKLDPDQEAIALGLANVVGSFFSAYPTTGGFSRTAVCANAGQRRALVGGLNVLDACLRSTHARAGCLFAVNAHARANTHTTYTLGIHIHIQGPTHNWLVSSRVSSCSSSSLPLPPSSTTSRARSWGPLWCLPCQGSLILPNPGASGRRCFEREGGRGEGEGERRERKREKARHTHALALPLSYVLSTPHPHPHPTPTRSLS